MNDAHLVRSLFYIKHGDQCRKYEGTSSVQRNRVSVLVPFAEKAKQPFSRMNSKKLIIEKRRDFNINF